MNISSSKENILKKIRKALSHSTPLPFPKSEGHDSVYQPLQQELAVEFAEQFSKLLGKFIYCLNHRELSSQLSMVAASQQWNKILCREEKLKAILRQHLFDNFSDVELKDCDVSITGCEALVARTGSIVLSAAQESENRQCLCTHSYLHRIY